jgi:uncharacterized membrane protein (UPF0127 family)
MKEAKMSDRAAVDKKSNSGNMAKIGGHATKWIKRAAIAAVFFLAGLYIVAPMLQARQPSYLPQAYLSLPLGAVTVMNAEEVGALLPVRIAETSQARNQGFKGVGEQAMDHEYLLYTLTRPTTSRATYSTTGFQAATDFAAIDAEGAVVAIHRASAGAERLAVAEPHRWLLVAKAGQLERMGIVTGSTIDPDSVRKF